jgi:hypothetical protein
MRQNEREAMSDSSDGQARISGKFIAEAAAVDFGYFFLPDLGPKIAISIENALHPGIRTNAEGTRIVIPPEMAADQVDSLEGLFFHLLIIGHEIAHVVHRHGYAGEQSREDYRSLEYWADYYGAKVMMTLVVYGDVTSRLHRMLLPEGATMTDSLLSIGQAVGRLVETVYSDDPRYPPKLLRAGLINNGVTSVLRHDIMKDANPIWYYSVYKRVMGSDAVHELKVLKPEDLDLPDDEIDRARNWHRAIQGDKPAIEPWLKPQYLKYLHTNFDQSEEERAAAVRERTSELRAGGFDV